MNSAIKKITCFLLTFSILFSVTGCVPNEEALKPATPQNISVDENALITWDAVEGASGYIVTINGTGHTVTSNSYQGTSNVSFTFSVTTVVMASNGSIYYSEASETKSFVAKQTPITQEITVNIVGASDIEGGRTLKLAATVTNSVDTSVTWTVLEGSSVASVDANGVVTTKTVTEPVKVTIEARSNADNTKYDTKTFTLGKTPVLTDAMFEALSGSKIAFAGFINISMYSTGTFGSLKGTQTLTVSTKMDGDNWYAEYVDSTGATRAVYCQNHNGTAALVGVNFKNEEVYSDVKDSAGNTVSWTDAGYYNSFAGLKASEFSYNAETGFFDYVGTDETLDEKMIAAANPYDFKADGFSLIVQDDEISGIYAKSQSDYTVVSGYRSVQELYSSVYCDEQMTVNTVPKYTLQEKHAPLTNALAKMQSLKSYTMDMMNYSYSIYTSGYTESNTHETLTEDSYVFVPYDRTNKTLEDSETNRTYDYTAASGYLKVSDNLYNLFRCDKNAKPVAERAYIGDISNSGLSFDFSAAIFTSYSEDSETGNITYYADEAMVQVATLFYNCTDNNTPLYGLYSSVYEYTDNYGTKQSIIPSVTVSKEGYIVSARFYFNMVYMYGIIDINFGNFDSATAPSEISFDDYVSRKVPTAWDDGTYFLMYKTVTDETTQKDTTVEVELKDFLKENFTEEIPFIGNAIGDTYGWGATNYHISNSSNKYYNALVLYYDVPLDSDATITSSINSIKTYLRTLGFTENSYGEFNKDTLWVEVVDDDLDLYVYIWSTAEKVGEN